MGIQPNLILKDYITLATSLTQEFATTAAERDEKGGNAKYERDRLRESGLLLSYSTKR